jgi:hypothetical protein
MPKATIISDVVRKDLKSCPGGYVELKQLAYSEMLARRDIVTRLSMSQKKDNDKIDVELANLEANRFSFKHCIVDHNLEDDNGGKLDFSNAMTLNILDPRIGQEIERHIDEMNQEADDENLEDFTPPVSLSSVAKSTEPQMPSASA